jgi:hypothetical protein
MAPPSVPSYYGTPAFAQPSPDFTGHFNYNNFDFNNMTDFPMTPALSDDRRESSAASSHSGLQLNGSGYTDALSPEDFTFDANAFDFNSFAYQQQPTPNSSTMPLSGSFSSHAHPVNTDMFETSYFGQASAGAAPLDPTFTPENLDDMSMDEGLGGDFQTGPNEDFTLFNNAPVQPSEFSPMFQPLAPGATWGNIGTQFDFGTDPTAPRMPTDSSALRDLFPELATE